MTINMVAGIIIVMGITIVMSSISPSTIDVDDIVIIVIDTVVLLLEFVLLVLLLVVVVV